MLDLEIYVTARLIDQKKFYKHILNQDGQFLRCVDNRGLAGPLGLSEDSDVRLWVGLFCSGEVIVIQYMK
jgi:hypothetical protein